MGFAYTAALEKENIASWVLKKHQLQLNGVCYTLHLCNSLKFVWNRRQKEH